MRLNDNGATMVPDGILPSVRASKAFCEDNGFTELQSKNYKRVLDQYGWWMKIEGGWILDSEENRKRDELVFT